MHYGVNLHKQLTIAKKTIPDTKNLYCFIRLYKKSFSFAFVNCLIIITQIQHSMNEYSTFIGLNLCKVSESQHDFVKGSILFLMQKFKNEKETVDCGKISYQLSFSLALTIDCLNMTFMTLYIFFLNIKLKFLEIPNKQQKRLP